MVGASNTKNATFVTHEARTRMLQKENENFRKMSEDSECDDIIDKYDFYRFDQQDMHYLVAGKNIIFISGIIIMNKKKFDLNFIMCHIARI